MLTPESVRDLSLALDYYNIEIDDVIRVPDGSTILSRCHEVSPASFDPTCGGLVLRDVNRGPLLEVFTITNNEDRIGTSGIDLEASYVIGDVGPGELVLNAVANILTKFDVIGAAGDLQDLKGEVLDPEARAVLSMNYFVNDFDLFAQVRYRSETKDRNDNTVHNEGLNTIDSATYLDLRGSYRFNDQLQAYVGVNNVFDSDPPAMGFSHKYFQQAINSNGTAFDTVGRQLFVGFNASFWRLTL